MPPASQTPLPTAPNPTKAKTITVVLAALFAISLVGNVLLFISNQNGKNSTNTVVKAAVTAAKAGQAATDKTLYDVAAKQPYKTFTGSATYGSISFSYPKNYSVYSDTTGSSSPINAYFYPDVVPSPQAKVSYALRLELTSQTYADVLNTYSSQMSAGKILASAYVPPKLKGVTNVSAGTLLSGNISTENSTAKGTLFVIKVRDKTLKIYDESNSFDGDFNNIVLPSLTFAP